MAGAKVKHTFSDQDKESLARFFLRHPRLGKRAPSTYIRFAATHPRHSHESWRGFYCKGNGGEEINRLIRRFVKKLADGQKLDESAESDQSDQSDQSDVPERAFTTDDDEALLAALVKAKINNRDAKSVFERLAQLTPKRHSQAAWRAHYKADAVNIYTLVEDRFRLHKRKKRAREAAEQAQSSSSEEEEKVKKVRVAKPMVKAEKVKEADAGKDVAMRDKITSESASVKARPRAIPKPIVPTKAFTDEDDALLVTTLAKGKLKSHSLDNVFLFLSQRSQDDNHSVDDWRERYEGHRKKFDQRVVKEFKRLQDQVVGSAVDTPSAAAAQPALPLLVEPDTEDEMKIDSNPHSHPKLSPLNDSPPTPNPTPPRTTSQDTAAPALPLPSHFNALRPAVPSTTEPTELIGDQLEFPKASQATSASADSILVDEDDRRIEESLTGHREEEELTESQKADFLIYGDFDRFHPDLRPQAPPIPRPLPPIVAGTVAEEIEAIRRANVVAQAAWTVEEADRLRDVKQKLSREAKLAEMAERARLASRKQEREKEIAEDKVQRANVKREKASAELERVRIRKEEEKERALAFEQANLKVQLTQQQTAKLRAEVELSRRSSSAIEGGKRAGTEEERTTEAKDGKPARASSKRPRASGLAMERSVTPAPASALALAIPLPPPTPPPVATTSHVKLSPTRKDMKRQREDSPPPPSIEASSSARQSAPSAKRARIVTPPPAAKAVPGTSTDVSLKTILQRLADAYSIPRKNVASLYFACDNLVDQSLLTDALDFFCERIEEGSPRHKIVLARIQREVWSYGEDCVAITQEARGTEELRLRKGKAAIQQRRKFLRDSGRTTVEQLVKGWPWTGWSGNL